MFEIILNDEEVKAIINNVNNVIIVNNCGCHGMGHITRVMNYVKTILVGIGCDEHTIELGQISAYLHDIGAIMGKQGHAERSAEFVNNYLTKLNMDEEDKELIVNAIKNYREKRFSVSFKAATPDEFSKILKDNNISYRIEYINTLEQVCKSCDVIRFAENSFLFENQLNNFIDSISDAAKHLEEKQADVLS